MESCSIYLFVKKGAAHNDLVSTRVMHDDSLQSSVIASINT